MILGDQWKDYQSIEYWGSWDALLAGFWDPASRAAANFATGQVLVDLSAAADSHKQENGCGKTWIRIERPTLIQAISDGRVLTIVKYISPSTTPAGNIGLGYKDSCDNCNLVNPMSCNDNNCQGLNGLPGKSGTCMTDQYAGCPCTSNCPSGTLSCSDNGCAGQNGRCTAGEYNGCACQAGSSALQAAVDAKPPQDQ